MDAYRAPPPQSLIFSGRKCYFPQGLNVDHVDLHGDKVNKPS